MKTLLKKHMARKTKTMEVVLTMRSHIKKILVLVPSFLLVIVLISGFLIYQKIAHKDDIQEVLWDYNDNVSGTRLWDINGNEVPFPGSQNNIVMFLSSDCGHCLDSLSLYEKVIRRRSLTKSISDNRGN